MSKHLSISLIACCLLLIGAGCNLSQKSKRTQLIKTDSTHTANTTIVTAARSDQITTRQVYFTANKITEIDWVRDTTFKDTIIYKKKIRILEETKSQETREEKVTKTDTTTAKAEEKTTLKKEEKIKEKEKQSKPSALLLSIPFIVLILLALLYTFRKKLHI